MKSISRVLEHNGMTVTSRWLEERIPESSQLHDVTPAFCRETARADLEDICKSDTMVFFSEDPTVGTPRGGRHFEMGYASGLGKRLVVIGGPENIFHYLPEVVHYASLGDFIDAEGATGVTSAK
jgi:nucleoside 2-deoxyribosyltransferase